MINLTVNGKERSTEESIQLEAYLLSFGVNLDHVAVGYNGEVIKKEEYSKVRLSEGDVLEIVRPVGGG